MEPQRAEMPPKVEIVKQESVGHFGLAKEELRDCFETLMREHEASKCFQ